MTALAGEPLKLVEAQREAEFRYNARRLFADTARADAWAWVDLYDAWRHGVLGIDQVAELKLVLRSTVKTKMRKFCKRDGLEVPKERWL